MILPSLYRVVEPLASFGLSANNDGVIMDVISPFAEARLSPAAMAGLRPGERIDLRAMRCIPPGGRTCASLVAVLGGLGGLQYVLPDRQIELRVIPVGGGSSRSVRLKAVLAPIGWANAAVLLADTVVGVLFIAVAFFLVWTRPSRMTFGFFLYAIWFNPGQTYAYYALLQPWPTAVLAQEFAEALAQGAAYAGLLIFALRFPSGEADARWRGLEAAVPWLGAVLAGLMLLAGGNLFGFQTEGISDAGYLSGYVVAAVVILVLLGRRRTLHPQDAARMRWAIAGCAIGLPAFIFAEIAQSSGLLQSVWGASVSPVAIGLIYLLHGVIAYFVGTAVRRRRVVSVVIPLRRGAILLALTLALGVPVLYLHDTIAGFGESLHLPPWAWPFVIGPVMALILKYLHEIAADLGERALNRRYHRARGRLALAAEAMLREENFAAIDRLLAEEAAEGLRLSSAAVFRSTDGRFRRAGPGVGWEPDGLGALDAERDGIVLAALARGGPVRLPRGAWQRPGLPGDDQAPCLAVPVAGGAREGIAVALFGPHLTGSDIDHDERELLAKFAAQAAVAYERVEAELLRREVRELRARLAAMEAAGVDGSEGFQAAPGC